MTLKDRIASGMTTAEDAELYERQRKSLFYFLLSNGWMWFLGLAVVGFILGALLF